MYSVTVEDEATPWLLWAMNEFPDLQRKAMKSLGWHMQREIKKGIRSRAPGGRAYAPFLPAKKRRELDKAFGRQGQRSYRPLGGLVKAVGYHYSKQTGGVVVGWLSASAAKFGEIHEKGKKVRVTKKTRLAFLSAKLGMKPSTTEIDIPARPTIGPMRDVLLPKAPKYVEDKIFGYLTKGVPKKVFKSGKKYKVWG